jgi:hypothetical protein
MNFATVREQLNIDPEKLLLEKIKITFPGITGGDELEAMEIPPPAWVIQDLLPVGLTILGGAKKLGKSYLIMQFCRDIVEDGGTVFYFAGEDTFSLHKERQMHTNFKGTKDYQFFAGREGQFSNPTEFYSHIEKLLDYKHFDAIFIDTMVRALRPQSMTPHRDDYNYYVAELEPWTKLAHRHQTAILMATHSTKSASQQYVDPLDRILGSTGITATADWVLVMTRSEDGQGITLYSDGKMGPSNECRMEKNNGIFHEIVGKEREAAIKKKAAQNKILSCIESNPGIRQFQISQHLNMHKQNVNRAIKKLLKDEFIIGSVEEGYSIIENP